MRAASSVIAVLATAAVATGFIGAVRLHAQNGQASTSTQSSAKPWSQMSARRQHSVAGEIADAKSPGDSVPKLAEERFKNIQVLKGIPADQLIPSMQFVAASLGVECDYCHVEHAFDKDDKKPKQTARKMISMMMAINKANFDGHREVTCNTCHRGKASPMAIPAVASGEESERVEPEKSEQVPVPAALDLLDKYLAAVGGRDTLHKITSRVEKGNLIAGFPGMDEPMSIELYAKAPDKRMSIMHTPGGDSVTAFNGTQGWLSIGGRSHLMTAAENDAARLDADLYFADDVRSLYPKFVTQAGEKIDGRDTWLVEGRSEPGAANAKAPMRLYLDKETGLLLRLVRYAETPLGRNPTQIDYADYRAVDGLKIPFRWILARPGGRFTIQVDSVQQNVAVDDAKFVAPAAQPTSH